MKYLKSINVLVFVCLCAFLATSNMTDTVLVDGYYKRKEIIISKGEDKIELTTNIDVFANEKSTHRSLILSMSIQITNTVPSQ